MAALSLTNNTMNVEIEIQLLQTREKSRYPRPKIGGYRT
jgi:hypothetical protein